MARYIDVDELRMKIHDKYTISYFKPTKEDMQLIGIFEIINAQPTADVAEIPKSGIGDLSDGYHTFNELYHHRAVLFSVICNSMPDKAWKSKLHDTGDMYDGMFIVGIETPNGQATYHYDIEPYWDMFKVRELEKAPKWDGHTPTDAINRIASLSVDVKGVVRCEDCQHKEQCPESLMIEGKDKYLLFCSCGEKRDENKHAHWKYWDGWCGNHDQRIEDATCSNCGYKHPTVRLDYVDGKFIKGYVPDKLAKECPKCGAKMDAERNDEDVSR